MASAIRFPLKFTVQISKFIISMPFCLDDLNLILQKFHPKQYLQPPCHLRFLKVNCDFFFLYLIYIYLNIHLYLQIHIHASPHIINKPVFTPGKQILHLITRHTIYLIILALWCLIICLFKAFLVVWFGRIFFCSVLGFFWLFVWVLFEHLFGFFNHYLALGTHQLTHC